VPTLHGVFGLHELPWLQELQLPLLQTFPEPQPVPFGAFPDSLHSGAPALQTTVPTRHAAGSHIIPEAHGTQAPLLHTMLLPQFFPLAAFPATWHCEAPLAHEVLPILQASLTEQGASRVQATQLPPLQNMLSPHGVPLATAEPESRQSAVPVTHESVPAWHLLVVGVHDDPALHSTHAESRQTFVPSHALPLGAGPAATQIGEPVLHSILPTRQESVVVVRAHAAPCEHVAHSPVPPQNLPAPQVVPEGTGSPESLQVGVPPEQSSAPL
jgi:hypothetical protein